MVKIRPTSPWDVWQPPCRKEPKGLPSKRPIWTLSTLVRSSVSLLKKMETSTSMFSRGLVQTKVTHLVTPVESKKTSEEPTKTAVSYSSKKTKPCNTTRRRMPSSRSRSIRKVLSAAWIRDNGVVANLSVINPSFELPNIRTIPEFQKQHGSTLFRPVYGWSVSGSNREKTKVAMYQISPYDSSVASCNVGPGATDGQQVATISLGVKASSAAGGPRSNWMYQSLGIITSADLGKTLKLSVDAGPRSGYGGQSHGDGTVFAAFATHVTSEQSGTMLGTPCFLPSRQRKGYPATSF